MKQETKKRKEFPFVRTNTRIRPDQAKYVKTVIKKRKAKGENIGEAELHREIFDYYMITHAL